MASPSKVLVFGASGGTGRAVVAAALEQGHDVTACVRDGNKLTVSSPRLQVVEGDTAEDPVYVYHAVQGQSVVVSTLGVGKSFNSRHLIERSVRNIVRAMETSGVRRLILTSAFGVGSTRAQAPLVPRIFMGTLLRSVYADKKAGEDVLRRSNLDWTVVCPTGLTSSPGRGTYRAGEHLELHGFPTISRADLAQFILTQLDDDAYIRKSVLVSH